MYANTTYYRRINDELNDQITVNLNGRHQLDYDYNGCISEEDDPADVYGVVKAVRIA